MHLLDTDTVTHLHAGHPRVIERLRQLADPDVGITIITKMSCCEGVLILCLKPHPVPNYSEHNSYLRELKNC